MRRLSLSIFLLVCSLPALGQTKSCIDWPKVFSKEEVLRLPATKDIVAVAPLVNDTDMEGDAWISQGLAELLIRFLQVDSSLAVLQEVDAALLPPESSVRFKVVGLFQHSGNWLRIFIQLKDAKGNPIAQPPPIETPYPLHRQFFTGMRQAAEKIGQKMGRKEMNAERLSDIENETDNIHAYENFIKGEQALESYDPNKTEVALIWFQESRREDGGYAQAYRGMMEAYGFQSLVHKHNGEPNSADIEGLQNTMRALEKRGRKTGDAKKKKGGGSLGNRYLEGNVHYVNGLRELAKNNFSKAVKELEQAATLVPEDALASYNLGLAYDKLGKKESAGKWKNHAEAIDPCLKEE